MGNDSWEPWNGVFVVSYRSVVSGASLNLRDNRGRTALTLAETALKTKGQRKTVEVLKAAGEYVVLKDSSNLHFFASALIDKRE